MIKNKNRRQILYNLFIGLTVYLILGAVIGRWSLGLLFGWIGGSIMMWFLIKERKS